MSLYTTILEQLSAAMKAQDAERLGVLRLIKAALLNVLKETGVTELDDAAVIAVLQKEAKKRRESIEAFTQAQRPELAEQEQKELAIIEAYLPAQLSDDEIKVMVEEVITEMGKENFGAVMGAVMKRVAGQADGGRVKAITQSCIGS